MINALGRILHFACAIMIFSASPAALHAQVLERIIERVDPNDLSALLAPYYRVTTPTGDGPFPTALLASGCDGPKDNMALWADELKKIGWASVMIDSHTPRGYDEFQLWRLICVGQVLPGAQRAGDLAVALRDVAKMPFVDPERLVLLGASHGGWSILDLFALAAENRRPYGLTRWPDGPKPDELAGAVLLYPYCGFLSRVSDVGWSANTPMQFILVEGDQITNEDDCLAVIDRMSAEGRPTQTTIIQGATHGFDQQDRSFFSPLQFNQDATDKAIAVVTSFLEGL